MARAKTYHTRALVIKQTKLSEQDLILTLLTQAGSLLQVVAKGARKPGAKLAAPCELFSETKFLISHTKSLDIVLEAETVQTFASFRCDLEKNASACVVCDVCNKACFNDAEDAFIYPLVVKTLATINVAADQAHLDVCVAAFTFKITSHLGWRPCLEQCVLCTDTKVSRISARAGGVICEQCARDIEGAEPISSQEIHALHDVIYMTYDELMAKDFDSYLASWLLAQSHIWASIHLDARFASYEFLLSL